MSIHVTVSSNPLYIDRSKILLTDIDEAKKNEWNRRRKLRLQQVRQQSKDLASDLRKKCNAEKKTNITQECDENEQELKRWQTEQLQKLQEEYENCIAALGSGHRTAVCQAEQEKIAKEKQELRSALAKARGDLARVKAKKDNLSQIKPASTKISSKGTNVPNIHSNTQSNRNRNNTPPKRRVRAKSIVVDVEVKKVPTECTIPSPHASLKHSSVGQRKVLPRSTKDVRRQHSYSPPRKSNLVKETTVCACDDDSDDSNATWPPRTARVTKGDISPQKVKFYNHDEKLCKEYMKPTRSVTHIDLKCGDEMDRYIEEEEEAVTKRTEHDAALKKQCDIRGQKALQKERLQKEFNSMARKFAEIDKHQRITRIFEFPYPVARELNKSPTEEKPRKSVEGVPSTSRGPQLDDELKRCFEAGSLLHLRKDDKKGKNAKEDCSEINPFTLKNLIKDLEKERDMLMNSTLENSPSQKSKPKGGDNNANRSLNKEKHPGPEVPKINEQNISHHATNKIPPENSTSPKRNVNRVKWPNPIEVNVVTKPLCKCCESCSCVSRNNIPTNNSSGNENDGEGNLKDDEKNDSGHQEQSTHPETTGKNIIGTEKSSHSSNAQSKGMYKKLDSKRTKKIENDGSTSSEEFNISLKITEKSRNNNKFDKNERVEEESEINEEEENEISWRERLGGESKENSYSSSSYCSPPRKLTPAQQDALNFILLKMCLKNNNPTLHKYIKRLLSMNKDGAECLAAVSSPSEVSIQSDLFASINTEHVLNREGKKLSRKSKAQKETINNRTNTEKSKIIKKVVHLNSSSEDSSKNEITHSKKGFPSSSKLADEYSSRLNDLVQMLNQCPEFRGRHIDTSSYIAPPQGRAPLSERFHNSYVESSYSCDSETDYTEINQVELDENKEERRTDSAFLRNNISSFGLPFELLPKPFTLGEKGGPDQKPPVSSHKYRLEDLLHHELSAIPEVPSSVGISHPTNALNIEANQPSQLSELATEDDKILGSNFDFLDISSIKNTPQKLPPDENMFEEPLPGLSEQQQPLSDTSSLSILSHLTNESLIGIGSDVSVKDIKSFLESPSEYMEEVFRSLGVGWALSTLRKTRLSRQKDSTSTTTVSSENNSIPMERPRSKPISRVKGALSRSHSTPKKMVEQDSSSSSSVSEELYRKFQALKNERLSLTPPDLSLNVQSLGALSNNFSTND